MVALCLRSNIRRQTECWRGYRFAYRLLELICERIVTNRISQSPAGANDAETSLLHQCQAGVAARLRSAHTDWLDRWARGVVAAITVVLGMFLFAGPAFAQA